MGLILAEKSFLKLEMQKLRKEGAKSDTQWGEMQWKTLLSFSFETFLRLSIAMKVVFEKIIFELISHGFVITIVLTKQNLFIFFNLINK